MAWAQGGLWRAPPSARLQHTAAALQPTQLRPSTRRISGHGRRLLRQRAAGSGEGGSGEGSGAPDEEQQLRDQARLLNELFYSPSAVESDDASGPHPSREAAPSSAAGEADPPSPLLLHDLPLWRVQWAALPGNFEITHVHVPHYCAMFQRLFRGPRPHRFGHVYLPEGSKNLGNPEYALAPGTKAPLAGTLMEVLQAVRFSDGRLLILAVGVGRFRAVRETQEVPYCRATVELLLDAEEQQQFEGLALQAVESVRGGLDAGGGGGGGGEIPLTALMAAVPSAAREAAAVYCQAWLDYELSEARVEGAEGPAVIDGSRSGDAQVLGRRLAAIAGNEIMELPFFQALSSAAQEAAAGDAAAAAAAAGAAGNDASSGSGSGSGVLQQALATQRAVLRQTEAAAYMLATSAAARCVARHLVQHPDGAGSAGAAAAASAPRSAPPALNTASERGIATQAPEEVLEAEECLSSEPDSLAVALRLEAAVWREIAAVHGLASKLRERAAPLPEGLRCLQPWQLRACDAGGAAAAAAAAAAGGEGGQPGEGAEGAGASSGRPGAHPDYPALRRVQRLSFGVASLLANVSAAEGRQAWVEAGSTCARLRLGLAALRKHRQVLAAVVAVEGL